MRKINSAFLAAMILLASILTAGSAAASSITNTRHDLSVNSTTVSGTATGGTAGIKTSAAAQNQVCVFCHTPHGANTTNGPLWNRMASTATYTMYSSDYLGPTGLNLTVPATPKARTKRCLGCHDGTVALGSVYNLPGSASGSYNAAGNPSLAMANNGVALPGNTLPAGNSNLGTSLANDHPVSYAYVVGNSNGFPTELNTVASVDATPLKIDKTNTPNTVECVSCHDPHDNQYTFFLRMADNKTLCTTCHNKTGWTASGHNTSGATANSTNYAGNHSQTTNFGATVGAVGCRSCHQTHNAGGAKYITKGVEEATCFNGTSTSCHGSSTTVLAGTSATARINIQTELGRVRRHPVIQASGAYAGDPTTYGAHVNLPGDESATQLGGGAAVNRHAECPDCHDPHQAQTAARKNTERASSGYPGISKALIGTWGVEPTTWPTPPTGAAITNNNQWLAASLAPAAYTKVTTPLDEYQVCLKCHSSYVTLNGRRDIAQEINPNNASYHGIVPLSRSTTGQASNTFVNTTTANEPWGSASAATRSRVWCSDCHGNNATTTTSPLGPHGSSLNGTGIGTSNSDKMLRATIVSSAGTGTPLCLLCHKSGSYWSGNTGSNMNRHGQWDVIQSPGCFLCHMYRFNGSTGAGTDGGNDGRIIAHGMNDRFVYLEKGTGLAGNGQMNTTFIGGQQTNTNFTAKTCTQDSNAMVGGCGAQHTNRSY